MTKSPLHQTLTDAWNRAKAAEQAANKERLAIEAQILSRRDQRLRHHHARDGPEDHHRTD